MQKKSRLHDRHDGVHAREAGRQTREISEMKYNDPYDHMSDKEFEVHMLRLLSKPESVSVWIRIPKPLLARKKVRTGQAILHGT
jgi:hypothetical protein